MMPSQKSLLPQGGRAILLSIKPKYSELIFTGSKQVEFRRSWAKENVSLIVIYSSSPVQRIVGMVEIEGVVSDAPGKLWDTCVAKGGGLTRKELFQYFRGKAQGFAVLLGRMYVPKKPIDPIAALSNFHPPQSFRYLDAHELKKLKKKMSVWEKIK
jgi:predicted transcriptional regulator